MSIKNIKIIFVDIDWTILNHEDGHVFDDESIDALKKAREKGLKIIISTSRPYHSVRDIGFLDMLEADGYIFSNGGYVLLNDETIYQDKIPNEKLDELINLLKPFDATLECVEKDHHFFATPKNDLVDAFFSVYYESTPDIEDIADREVISCLLFMKEEYDQQVIPFLPEGLKYYRFTPSAVDIVYHHREKGDGVKLILEKLNFKKDEAMAFGDDVADISMFQECAYSFAMENGKDEVKKAAYEITKSVRDHGVSYALKKYKII